MIFKFLEKFGGAEGNRTPDLYVANVALSQLSYGPTDAENGPCAGPTGLRSAAEYVSGYGPVSSRADTEFRALSRTLALLDSRMGAG